MAKIIKLNETDLNRLVARVIKEQAATAASIAAKKPVMMSDRVKQLVGFLKNGNYSSSEIQQAQNIIKNPPATRAPQKGPIVVSQKSQQLSQQNQPASKPVAKTGGAQPQPVVKAGSASYNSTGYGA